MENSRARDNPHLRRFLFDLLFAYETPVTKNLVAHSVEEDRHMTSTDLNEAEHQQLAAGALAMDKALEVIANKSGSMYDPDVVAACQRLIHEKGYKGE